MEAPTLSSPSAQLLSKLDLVKRTITEINDVFAAPSSLFQNKTAYYQSKVIDDIQKYLDSEYKRLDKIKEQVMAYRKQVSDLGIELGRTLTEESNNFAPVYEEIKVDTNNYLDGTSPCFTSVTNFVQEGKEEQKIVFVSKISKKTYKISYDILKKFPGSYFYQMYIDIKNHDQNGYIELDKDDTYYNAIFGYMEGQEYNFDQHTIEDNENLANALEDVQLPFSKDLLNMRCSLHDKKKFQAYATNKVVMVNGKNDTELNTYLITHHLLDTLFGNTKASDIHYYEDTSVYYINLKLNYADYIRNYIQTGTYNLKAVKSTPIDPNTFFEEFQLLSIPLPLDALDIFSPFYESTIISEEKAASIVSWPNMEQNWHLLYRASDFQYDAIKFHSLCDNHPNILVLVKVINDNGNTCIFGGYSTIGWNPYLITTTNTIADDSAFLFTIDCPYDIEPTQFKHIKSYALTYEQNMGPTFYGGFNIVNDCHNNKDSYFDINNQFSYDLNTSLKYNLFINSDPKSKDVYFTVEDYEVFATI